jgi:hypothetical protein
MGLSDACAEFGFALEDGEALTEAAKDLLAGVEHYGAPDYPIPYPPLHIEALRHWAKLVIAEPENEKYAANLRTLAEAIRIMHDMPP